MTNLVEEALWPDGIYQIETTDPVLGGPPNLATKDGLSNIQAQQLAQRTLFLKEAIGAMGGAAAATPNAGNSLNIIVKGGMYAGRGDTEGNPVPGTEVHAMHTQGPDYASQTAITQDNRFFWRTRENGTDIWTAWQEAVSQQSFTASALLASDGYQILPSGLIIQWRSVEVNGQETVTLPITFPNDIFQAIVSDHITDGSVGNAHYLGTNTLTTSSVNVVSLRHSDLTASGSTVRLLAIGH
ncbi:MAG: hypothetical protein AB3N21_15915 [Ruegeria sp.]|uniref:gp53-like domain-containing protein n=1 Tax=Ruegeria sp. TaxID=1879320 RepID=UPI00349E89E6